MVHLPEAIVVIEAKIDAGEQDEQCDRLVGDWGIDSTSRYYMFLAPRSHAPPTTDESDSFKMLAFEDVRNILEDAIHIGTDLRRPTGYGAALTYLDTLRQEFPNEPDHRREDSILSGAPE